jgi:membrane associated rhomboid family serine protease
MGIHDRDYYRDGGRGVFESFGQQGVTVWLIIITCVVFFCQLITRDVGNPVIDQYLAYSYDRVTDGEVWRLVSSIFLHGGLLHLAFNMIVLYWAGTRLEDRYGSAEFLAFYLTAGLFAGTFRFATQAAGLAPPVGALGASGAITAVLVLFACHYPHQRVYLYFAIPMPVWLVVVICVSLDALGTFGVGQAGIGYLAHIGGAFFGMAYFQAGRRITSLLPSLPSRSARRVQPRLRIVPSDSSAGPEDEPEPVGAAVQSPPRPEQPPDEHLEARVDRILEKVSKFGQESLTPEERELLFRASELYKKRRK